MNVVALAGGVGGAATRAGGWSGQALTRSSVRSDGGFRQADPKYPHSVSAGGACERGWSIMVRDLTVGLRAGERRRIVGRS